MRLELGLMVVEVVRGLVRVLVRIVLRGRVRVVVVPRRVGCVRVLGVVLLLRV